MAELENPFSAIIQSKERLILQKEAHEAKIDGYKQAIIQCANTGDTDTIMRLSSDTMEEKKSIAFIEKEIKVRIIW